MTDPTLIITAAGWLAALIALVVARIRSQPSTEDITEAIRAEVRPVYNVVDNIDHETAVLRQEIGRALSVAEVTADRVRELEDDFGGRIARLGEVLDRRTATLEERMARIAQDAALDGE